MCFYVVNGSSNLTVDNVNIQIEEGTVATPYEPYQEDKLTILSPVQLEKVGDVADRIVCKDGVWGVEKNTFRSYLKDFTWQRNRTQENTTSFQSLTEVQNLTSNGYNAICKGFKTIRSWSDEEHYHYGTYNSLKRHVLTIAKNKVATIDDLNKFLLENNNYVICIAEESTFIPLPHDQQVKLRTFANKTNISFLTEIEGTIKAQVPKSLGATVNTHTEQISNLNKELDRVKKLEESTVSTVETESDFTTVEATNGGYFEDVKLEGKTLVVNADNEIVEPGTEGATLKSVGDGADEIVVSSVNENLFDGKLIDGYFGDNTFNKLEESGKVYRSFKVYLPKGEYCISFSKLITRIRSIIDGVYSNEGETSTKFNIKTNADGFVGFSFRDAVNSTEWDNSPITINKGTTPKPYTPHKSDKKRLLYYNPETQAWEKPILRQWDSIEKHSDGKYYYHKRSGEVVFDGSEDEGWTKADNTDSGYSRFFNGTYSTPDKHLNADVICDKLPTSSNTYLNDALFDCVGGVSGNNRINVKYKGDLTVSDLTNKLSNSPLTVVYQLAQEKVYECTNIDLITYANETNFIIESGAIVPRTTLKVHNNISNVVSLLQKKVSLLESNIKASQEVQDMMILETDMRMLDIELALMEFIPMTLNLGGSNMLRSATYFNFLKNHIINETYEKEYLENVMNKYLATGRINQDEYNELYKILYPPVYDIELPIEY